MYAVVTGASSGLGRQFAIQLANKYHYDLIVVARRRDRLEQLASSLSTNVVIYEADLSERQNCLRLFEFCADYDVDLLVNNAGLGDRAPLLEGELDKQLNIIDVNVTALHVLTRLFGARFVDANRGRIINVASAAGFIEGPFMATYYASKNYVRVLTNSLAYELRKMKSAVQVSVVCPGPVKTEFDEVANVDFIGPLDESMSASRVVAYALKKSFKGRRVIVPGFKQRLMLRLAKLTPATWTKSLVARYQVRKRGGSQN